MEHCTKVGIDVAVNTPITQQNVDHLAELGEFFVERGASSLCFIYLAAYGNALSVPNVIPSYDRTAVALAELCDRLGGRLPLHIDNFPFCLLPGREQFIVAEMANPYREIAYPTGGVIDVSSYFRWRKIRLPQCDGCGWDSVCGGIQDLDGLADMTQELVSLRLRPPTMRKDDGSSTPA